MAGTAITRLYTPNDKVPMQVAVFTSGRRESVEALLAFQKSQALLRKVVPYRITCILTDNAMPGNTAKHVAMKYGVEYFLEDYKRFLSRHDGTEPELRVAYFDRIRKIMRGMLRPINLIVLADFMLVIPGGSLLNRYKSAILNVHPADFAVRRHDGRVKYTGLHAVREAILDGAMELRSTAYLVVPDVDQGPAIARSAPLPVVLPEGVTLNDIRSDMALADKVAAAHQERLRLEGDVYLYPRVLQLIGGGRLAIDNNSIVYFDGGRIPAGGLDPRELAR